MTQADDAQRSVAGDMKAQLFETAGTLRGLADGIERVASAPDMPDATTFLNQVVYQLGMARAVASEDLRVACAFANSFYALSARRIAEHAGVSGRTVSYWLSAAESGAGSASE